MRILHLTRDFPPGASGGVSVASSVLVATLDGAAIPTGVISFDRWRGGKGGEDHEEGERCVLLRVRAGRPFDAIAAAAQRLRPTLVHLHHENLLPFARQLCDLVGCPLVYTVHTLHHHDRSDGNPSLSALDQERALDSADLVTVPSRFAAEEIASAVRDPAAVRVVPNIVRRGAVPPPPDRRPSQPPLATYVGRFDHAKGTDVLFDVMARVLAAHPTLRFEIAGGLPASRKRERRWLRCWETQKSADLARRVRFRGWLEGRALEDLYARSVVQVVPSRRETFGLGAAEAMARGLAVAAARCGALAELIEDGETGVLCETSADLAEAVVRLIREPARAREIGDRAARSVAERYRPDVVLPQWIAAYQEASRLAPFSPAAPRCE